VVNDSESVDLRLLARHLRTDVTTCDRLVRQMIAQGRLFGEYDPRSRSLKIVNGTLEIYGSRRITFIPKSDKRRQVVDLVFKGKRFTDVVRTIEQGQQLNLINIARKSGAKEKVVIGMVQDGIMSGGIQAELDEDTNILTVEEGAFDIDQYGNLRYRLVEDAGKPPSKTCPHCHKTIQGEGEFCPMCGGLIKETA